MFSSEKTKVIDIPRTKTSPPKDIPRKSFECKMDVNTFDPTKHSPPNPWLQKLQSRIEEYYTQEQLPGKPN